MVSNAWAVVTTEAACRPSTAVNLRNGHSYAQSMYYTIAMKPIDSIRIDPEFLDRARVAAVKAKKTLGDWLVEAIGEKITRDKDEEDVDQKKR